MAERKYKKTTFREGYNPTKAEFKKTFSKVIPENEIDEAFKVLQSKDTKETEDAIEKK